MSGARIFVGVLRSDHAAERRGNQDLDVEFQQGFVRDMLATRIARERIGIGRRVTHGVGNIEALFAVVSATHVTDRDDLAFRLVQKVGRV